MQSAELLSADVGYKRARLVRLSSCYDCINLKFVFSVQYLSGFWDGTSCAEELSMKISEQ